MFKIDNSYGLVALQQRLLDSLVYFDHICRENEIHYSLHGGTLLGAERNHRFIPWDDDVDVSMTREDYIKFKRILAAGCYPQAVLYENILWVSRFVYTASNNDSVFIDILIYDYISENSLNAFFKISLLRVLQGMLKPKENLVFSGRNFFYRFSIVATYLIGKLFSQKRKLKWYHFISEKCFLGNMKMIHRSNDNFYSLSYKFDKGFMENYSDIEFEGFLFMANARYKEFLCRSYGENYLTPPPDKERMPQHAVIRESISKKSDTSKK